MNSEAEEVAQKKENETIADIIKDINEEYFSDLQPDEIPDSHVSDVDESEIDITSMTELEEATDVEAQIQVQKQLINKYQ